MNIKIEYKMQVGAAAATSSCPNTSLRYDVESNGFLPLSPYVFDSLRNDDLSLPTSIEQWRHARRNYGPWSLINRSFLFETRERAIIIIVIIMFIRSRSIHVHQY